jgi:crotonobetainyl-CoA:carnitine CoA-transferase CaiB-like acyl-CoA transferase
VNALHDIVVVEIAERVTGEYCGKLLADFGARVIKIERPGKGSPTRAMAPTLGARGGVEGSGLFAYLNTNKESVVQDLNSENGRAFLHELISSADVVIDDHDEEWLMRVGLAPERVERDHSQVVFCSITPYGHGTPRDRWNATSLNVFHDSGWGYHTPSSPDLAKPPLKGPGRFLVDYEGALDAALCIVSSLYWRGQSGIGQFIDLSQREVMMSRADILLGRFIAGEVDPSNERKNYDQGGPQAFFPCRDGAVYLFMTTRSHWAGLRKLMGDPDWMQRFDDDWLEFKATEAAVSEFRAHFAEWIRTKERHEISAEAQRLGVPLVPTNDASDLPCSPQYIFRKFFQHLKHPVLGEALYPTVPYRLSASPAILRRPAPLLGEHSSSPLPPREPKRPTLGRSHGRDTTNPRPRRGGPLEGIRVLELTKVWAGPYAGKLLAFLGAEVIKVESNQNLDEMRAYGGVDPNHAPYFLSLNPEILSVQVNLKSEKGMSQLRDMVAKSDIVLNNFRPGAMERLGLDFERLRAIKPDIIFVSIKMFGNDGPLGYQTGYAPSFAALGGLSYLVGYEGEPPMGINMRYGDSTVGANTAFAAIVALLHREQTGEGQFIDISAVECMSSMVGDALLEHSLTGQVPRPDGNAHADMAPHGCYRCLADEWIAIAVASDTEWRQLCEVLDATALHQEPRFRTLAQRQAHRNLLDKYLADAVFGQDASQLAARLRAAGVAASKSATSLDMVSDETLWQRGIYRLVADWKAGSRPIVGVPWRMSRASATISSGAPRLGEHNTYVYCDVLGRSSEELEQLIRDGAVD